MVKDILLDVFFAMKEPTLQNTKQFTADMKRKRQEDEVQTTKQPRLY